MVHRRGIFLVETFEENKSIERKLCIAQAMHISAYRLIAASLFHHIEHLNAALGDAHHSLSYQTNRILLRTTSNLAALLDVY